MQTTHTHTRAKNNRNLCPAYRQSLPRCSRTQFAGVFDKFFFLLFLYVYTISTSLCDGGIVVCISSRAPGIEITI